MDNHTSAGQRVTIKAEKTVCSSFHHGHDATLWSAHAPPDLWGRWTTVAFSACYDSSSMCKMYQLGFTFSVSNGDLGRSRWDDTGRGEEIKCYRRTDVCDLARKPISTEWPEDAHGDTSTLSRLTAKSDPIGADVLMSLRLAGSEEQLSAPAKEP